MAEMADNRRRKRKQTYKTLNCSEIEPTEFNNEKKKKKVGGEQWRDWASMTEPLLQSILSLLTTLQDFSSFRSVCKSWMSVAIPNRENLSHQSPLLLLHHFGRHTKPNTLTKSFCDLSERRCYASPLPFVLHSSRVIGYSHGCFVAIPSVPFRRILLCNVISGEITRLPWTDSQPYRILLSAPPSSPTCIAVLLGIEPKILYCRIGDQHWTEFWFSQQHAVEDFQDVVFVRDRLHLLTPCGMLGVIDFAPRQEITFLEASKPDAKIGISTDDVPMIFLAESDGDLLLVNVRDGIDMFNDRSNLEGYRIWRWDFEGGRGLVEVTSLGERALFIGYDGSMALISASAGSGVRGNCIYQIQYHIHRSSYGWTVYSLDDRTLSVVLPKSLGFSMDDVVMPPVWIFPSLC